MALIHEKLYELEAFSKIGFSKYTRELVNHIKKSYQDNATNVNVDVNIKDIFLNIKIAIPCGLILNELLSNSFKYAFKNKTQGNIKIGFTKNVGFYVLSIEDDGIGIDMSSFENQDNSLGLSLVNALVEQLDGKIELDNKNGTKFVITFAELQ